VTFVLALQTAPERRGSIGTPSAWSSAGTDPVPAFTGTYLGATTRTYTLLVVTGGLIGTAASIVVAWSAGSNSGKLQLGTAHSYAANDVVYFDEGVSVAFPAGTFVTGHTLTVVMTAANRIAKDHKIVEGTALPVDIQVTEMTRSSLDTTHRSFTGKRARVPQANLRAITAMIDYLDFSAADTLRLWEGRRSLLSFADNFDETTVFYWRGGTAHPTNDGLLPLVGPYGTFARGSVATYQDRRSSLWRSVATGVPRYGAGRLANAIEMGLGATNLFTNFHPKSGTLSWSGTGTLTWDTAVKGVLDPDDTHWSTNYTPGVLRWEPASGNSISSADVTVSASVTYTCQVYLRGRGAVNVNLRAGAGAASNNRGTVAFTLTDTWQRCTVTAATVGGDTVGDISLGATEDSVVYISAMQFETGFVPTALIQTEGGTAARSAETLVFDQQIPMTEGTLSFDLFWPGDAGSSFYRLLETTDGDFSIRYDAAGSEMEFTAISAGTAVVGAIDLAANTNYHIAVTWDRSTANNMVVVIYANGSSIGTGTLAAANWSKNWGAAFDFLRTGAGQGQHAIRFSNLRIDSEAKAAAEVFTIYERYGNDEARFLELEAGGRFFEIVDPRDHWLSVARPDIWLADFTLIEGGREDAALLGVT